MIGTRRLLGCAAAAAVGIGAAATIVGAGPASATDKDFTVLVTVDGSHTDVDANDNGAFFDPGDYFVENTIVRDADGTDAIGHADTIVTFLDAEGEFQVTCTVVLGAGKLLFEGGGNFSELATGVVVPVTGGTGQYSQAAGTVTLRDLGAGVTEAVFDLNG